MLTELASRSAAHSGSAYEKVDRRVGDWAVVAAGASITLADDGSVADASIGVTAVGLPGTVTRAEDALRGRQPTDELFDEAARIASADCEPVADQRGPVDYKRHLAGELTRRVLRRARRPGSRRRWVRCRSR